jgi:hypothetical protein
VFAASAWRFWAVLLVATWPIAVFKTPSGSEMAELQAQADDYAWGGGKMKLSTCGFTWATLRADRREAS